MALNPDTRTFLQTKLPALIGFILLAYFAFHLMQGDKGILTYLSLRTQLNTLEEQEKEQAAKLEILERKVARLRPNTFDKDFAEEQARTVAGLKRVDEKIINLNRETAE